MVEPVFSPQSKPSILIVCIPSVFLTSCLTELPLLSVLHVLVSVLLVLVFVLRTQLVVVIVT